LLLTLALQVISVIKLGILLFKGYNAKESSLISEERQQGLSEALEDQARQVDDSLFQGIIRKRRVPASVEHPSSKRTEETARESPPTPARPDREESSVGC
jgi:hypothetical protein